MTAYNYPSVHNVRSYRSYIKQYLSEVKATLDFLNFGRSKERQNYEKEISYDINLFLYQ